MTIAHSYTKELENLILDVLLPIFEKYQKSKGVLNPLKDINPGLLSQLRVKKKLPRLLGPE